MIYFAINSSLVPCALRASEDTLCHATSARIHSTVLHKTLPTVLYALNNHKKANILHRYSLGSQCSSFHSSLLYSTVIHRTVPCSLKLHWIANLIRCLFRIASTATHKEPILNYSTVQFPEHSATLVVPVIPPYPLRFTNEALSKDQYSTSTRSAH